MMRASMEPMRALALCSLALLMGCQASTEGLDPTAGLDAGRPDSASDAGPADSGPFDSGPFDSGPGDASTPPDAGPTCNGPGFMDFVVVHAEGDFEGRAQVAGLSPLRLATPQGDLEFQLPEEVPLARLVSVGQAVYVTLELYRPWWTEARLLIQWLGPDNRPTGRALAIWSGSGFRELSVQGVSIGHRPDGCEFDNEGCGRQGGMEQVVRYGAETIVVNNDGQGVIAEYLVANRGSTTYLEPAQCSDTPNDWYAGWIVSQGAQPLDCAILGRDACIDQPGCVLWGSENNDPGYTCRPAADACEFLDVNTCATGPGCTWDGGDCYCPEDADCECGGGPAPKCRTYCGGWGGRECPASHYCALDLFQPPFCVPPADVGGTCEWVPDTCVGAPNDPVCTCLPSEADPQRLENDCQRRERRGQGTAELSICAP